MSSGTGQGTARGARTGAPGGGCDDEVAVRRAGRPEAERQGRPVNGADAERLRVAFDDIVVGLEAPSAMASYVRGRYTADASGPPAITSRLLMEARPQSPGGIGSRRISEAEGGLWCRGFPGMRDLMVGVRASDPPATVAYFSRSRLRRAYKRLVAGFRSHQMYEILAAYTVVYPALLAGEQRGRYVLHASAVVSDGRAVILLGLPGAGKSTLSAALQTGGFELLSDNLVAVGAAGVWSVPEPTKLDARSQRLVGDDGEGGLVSTYGRSARPLLAPPPGPLSVAAIVNVSVGSSTELTKDEAMTARRLIDLNELAYELHAYRHYRAFARLALPTSEQPDEVDVLTATLDAAPAVRLVVGRDDVRRACALVEGLL